jgi:heme/copper-type cytochrome/quinol oxidase subunit 1
MITLILRFLAAALVYFIVALLLGIAQLFNLSFLTPAHVHLAFVGFVCGVIIATMYQQVPTLTGAELHSKRAARASFWFFNAGIVVFSVSYPKFRLLASAGALLLLIAFYLFTYNVIATISNRKGESYVFKFYSASSIFLSIASTLGFLFTVNPSLISYRPTHVHLALVGGVALIIVGAMSWMLPMVVVKEIYSKRWMDYVFYAIVVASFGLAFGLALSKTLALLSGFVLLAAVLLFIYDMVKSYTAPTKAAFRATSVEARFFLAALAYLALTLLLGLALVLFPLGRGFVIAHAHLAALGFVVQTVIGGLYHVIPTLAWTKLIASEKERAPSSFKELFSAERSRWVFIAFNVGTLLLASGFAFAIKGVTFFGALLVAFACIAFAAEMLGVIRRAGAI